MIIGRKFIFFMNNLLDNTQYNCHKTCRFGQLVKKNMKDVIWLVGKKNMKDVFLCFSFWE